VNPLGRFSLRERVRLRAARALVIAGLLSDWPDGQATESQRRGDARPTVIAPSPQHAPEGVRKRWRAW